MQSSIMLRASKRPVIMILIVIIVMLMFMAEVICTCDSLVLHFSKQSEWIGDTRWSNDDTGKKGAPKRRMIELEGRSK